MKKATGRRGLEQAHYIVCARKLMQPLIQNYDRYELLTIRGNSRISIPKYCKSFHRTLPTPPTYLKNSLLTHTLSLLPHKERMSPFNGGGELWIVGTVYKHLTLHYAYFTKFDSKIWSLLLGPQVKVTIYWRQKYIRQFIILQKSLRCWII